MMRGKWRTRDGWRERAVTLLRETLPQDLPSSVPVYLITDREAPQDFPRDADTLACTSPLLDLSLRDCLGSRWRGRGLAMVVFRDQAELADEYALMGAVLHEAVHYFTWLTTLGCLGEDAVTLMTHSVETMAEPQRQTALKRVGSFRTDESPEVDIDLKPWTGHEGSFVWGCCHVGHRSWQFANLVGSWHVMGFAGHWYGLSHHNDYLRAAGDAPATMANKSLVEVLAIGPPPAFIELFKSDVERYEAWKRNHNLS